MVSSQTHGCLEPEVLAAYVDRGLSLAERAKVDAHLASCPQCIAMVAGVVRTVEAVADLLPAGDIAVEAIPRIDRRAATGMLTAAAAVLVVLAGPALLRPWLDRDTGPVSLANSVEGERSVLGRLTGGFPHAPLGVPSAGGQGGRAAKADRLVLIAGKIRESFGERETPSRLHALGVGQLLAGRYDDAATSLLAAVREQPNNARYVNDVAAVQLERARLGLRPDDLPRALASADRARRLDPSLREAWFNRALASTMLSLHGQATQAWIEYLARDSASPWASEARKRLEELSRPTPAAAWAGIEQRLHGDISVAAADEAVRAQMTEARNFVEHDLLPKWAAAVAAGQDGSRELNGLRNMADALARIGGDSLYRDTVAAIDRARSDDTRRALARAHSLYVAGAALFAQDRYADSAAEIAAARAQLTSSGSPFAIRAALDLIAIDYVGGKYDNALQSLAQVSSVASSNGYAYAAARAAWFQGLIAFAQSRLADAQSNYEDTLAGFERMGDAEQVAAAHSLLAALSYYLGDKEREWKHRQLAFQGLSISRSSRFKILLMGAASASVRFESPETALSIQDNVLAMARESGRSAAIVEMLSQRAATLISLDRRSEAATNIDEARQHLQSVTDPALRRLFELLVLAPEGDLQRLRDPQAAVATATRAIEIVEQRNDRTRLPQFQLQLAKANVAWGRLDHAEAAIRKGIQAFDEERALMSDEGRISAFDDSWQLFETAVQLAIRKRDYPRAFAMAERARTRTLAESKRASQPRSLAEAQQSLGRGEAILALSQFDDELAVWVIRSERAEVVMRPLTRRDAQRLVARQQDEIWHEASVPSAGRDLYNEIIRPVAGRLTGVSRLVVVPDATYQDAAFAALWDSSRRRFLVEDVTLSLAPSVSAYATATASSREVGEPMILGGPDRNSDASARAVASVYSASHLVTGPAATGSRFFADAPGRSVVHVSAQTASNMAYPLLSRVVLADEPGRRHSGAILGRDIAALPMSQTHLVVIDEVETDSNSRGEGTLSLARAFMAAGVPAVLGTLPGASEAATRDLMVGFHRQMLSSISPVDALTTLQRNVLQSNGRRLGAWSALVMYGSDR